MTAAADQLRHFDELFAADADPWRYRSSWYEERKRSVLLSALPSRRYASAYEPGCANGELTAALTARCDSLQASDGSAAAVRCASARLASFAHVRVHHAVMPRDWPVGLSLFDLVVLSEIAYYLVDADFDELLHRCNTSLAASGTLVACHWRRAAADFHRSAEEVHRRIGHAMRMPRLVHHVEADFLLDIWCTDPRSVAQHEDIA